MPATKGSRVKVGYIGKLKDGTVFDRSDENKPIEFILGEGKLIPGFEKAIEGMDIGSRKVIDIEPAQAYGQRDETLIRKFSKTILPENFKPEKGMIVKLFLPKGNSVPAKIIGITETEIVVDLNHPLAGQILTFELHVVEVVNN